MAQGSVTKTGISSRRNIRSTKAPGAVVQLEQGQIDDARRYLSDNLEPEDLNPSKLARGGREKVIAMLRQASNRGEIKGIPRNASDNILKALYNNTIGLGILEEFLGNSSVEQINVVGPKKIILQMNGIWTEVTDNDLLFRDTEELRMVADNIARRVGKELSKHTNPIVDIRFENPVLRIHINMTRRAHGISLYIRRGRAEPFSTEYLLEAGNFNRDVLKILQDASRRLIGCVFLGGVGSGKTVMLEKYIDWMPNVPIVVVDDAGDCQPSHSMCAVFDLPETSYTANKQLNLTLGGLTRAALREGDVMVVAETRGAEEAGILISDAPSMRCVVTTAHGDTAESGLSRLVSIAQRPPSPYAGTNSAGALRGDLKNAFPLVVQVNRRGDRRYIDGIYHNMGWNNEKGNWNLRPIVKAEVSDEAGIEWRIIDANLDRIKPFMGLDMMQTGRISTYEDKSPQRMLAEAMTKVDEQNWVEAIHLFSILLKNDPSNETVRQRLIYCLESNGDYDKIRDQAKAKIDELNDLMTKRLWADARKMLKQMTKQPTIYAIIWRLHPNLSQARSTVDAGFSETEEAKRIIMEGRELLCSNLSWTELRRSLNTLRNLDTSKLSTEAKAGVKFTHANLLVELVKRAPEANSQFYRQQLESFIGRDEASRRLNLREQTNV